MSIQSEHKILVINDKLDALELTAFTLKQAGYSVLTADGGGKGLELAANELPNLIISDVMMPDLNGIDLCRKLRAFDQLKTTPIILVTAIYKGSESVIEGLKAGADDYVTVPFEPIYLVAKVARLLERKNAEEERDHYFNVSMDMLCVADLNGYYKRLNPAWERTLGFTAEVLMSKPYVEFVHPEDREKTDSVASELVEGKPTFSFENRYLCKDGSYKWLSWRSTAVDESGLIYAVARDITQRKAQEQSIIESRQQISNILESISDGFFALDKNWNFTYLNSEAKRLALYSQEELLGKNIWQEFPAAVNSSIYEMYHRAMDEGTPVEFNEFYPDPFNCWYKFRAYPAKDGISVYFRDITKQKQAEEKLKRSERQLAEAQCVANIGSWELNIATGELTWSDETYRIFGLRPNEIAPTRENFFAAVHPEDRQMVMANERQTVAEGENFAYHHRIVLPDGSIRIVSERSAVIRDKVGKPVRLVGTVQDITEQQRAEKAIKKNETKFRAVFDNALDVMLIADDEGRYLEANRAACALLGLSKEEITKLRIEDLAPPHQKAAFQQAWRHFLEVETQRGEYEMVRSDGSIIQAEFSATANFLPGEHLAVLRDITARKQAEERLREADLRALTEYEKLLGRIARLAGALGTARDLHTIYQSLRLFALESTPCTGIFVSLFDPERQERLPSYAFSEGEEVDLSELPPMPMNESPHSRAVTTGQTIITDDFQTATEGLPRVNVGLEKDPALPQSSLVTPMSIMGRVIGAVEIQSTEKGAFGKEHVTGMQMAANLIANAVENVRLLEQERQKEEQLRQVQKMESVGRLAGGIAHDFNNMLTAINGYSDLTLRRLDPENPLRSNIEEIKKAGDRSAALTHQLLAFSRQQILQPKILDLNEIITDTSKMLQRLIGEDVELQLVLNSNISPIEADPGQLTQVIMNLSVNARDAMSGGGKIIIQTEHVYLNEEFALHHFPTEPGNYVMIAVTDNGSGMDDKTREHIFEPFFTTKGIGEGTGLGLSTVYGIVKQSGGYIWVDSQLGKGTTFRIYLPPAVTKQAETQIADTLPASGSETILLVEDEETVRTLGRLLLEECGYQVIEVEDGKQALEICKQKEHKIVLLMTDVVMPEMGGRELAEKLSEIAPDIKVLFTSGYTDDAVVRHGITETTMNFIQKPFSLDILAQKVRQILDSPNKL
jgi:PAS domain S-box-containing protein